MFETNQFNLPLLQASQAQKHVTVNEAIARLDAMAQLRLESLVETLPPLDPVDGVCFWVPPLSQGEWTGQDNTIAIFSNGGWVFLNAKEGWNAWVVDQGSEVRFLNGTWVESVSNLEGSFGSNFALSLNEAEHVIVNSRTNISDIIVPAGSLVAMIGVRVTEEILTDGASDWRLGVEGALTRFGTTHELSLNYVGVGGTNRGMLYYPDEKKLSLSVPSGNFLSGKVVLSVYAFQCGLPAAV